MPNTLAHLGVGAVVSRSVFTAMDPKWIYLGCLVPDIPWILQRIVLNLPIGVDPYELRLYAIAQSSLVVCLVLSGALAILSDAPRTIFYVLGLNSAVHLLLDASQTKWANGVHLFAPVTWSPLNAGLYWPESIVTYALTAFGFAVFIALWPTRRSQSVAVTLSPAWRSLLAVVLLAVYFVAPIFLSAGPLRADNHSVRTLRDRPERTGRYAEFDRAITEFRDKRWYIYTLAGEPVELAIGSEIGPGKISLQGRFVDEQTFHVTHSHYHNHYALRDFASIAGISLVGLCWIQFIWTITRGRP